MRRVAVIGAPTSAGAFAPGQEDGPAALRDAGLLERLAEAGVDAVDLGDIPGFAWRPDPDSPRAMNVAEVGRAAVEVAARVRDALAADRLPLVLGGDCTIELGTVLGCADQAEQPGLVYLDPHPDLNTPASVPDGALDWMGVAHLLDAPGAVEELAGLGPRRPLLNAGALVLFGASSDRSQPGERATIERLGLEVISEAEVAADPVATAADAVRCVTRSTERYLVHFDVDSVDFADAPLSENTDRNVGLTLDTALAALAALLRGPALAGLTITELNPHHAAAVPGLLERFAAGVAAAVAGPTNDGR
jgi:arginase